MKSRKTAKIWLLLRARFGPEISPPLAECQLPCSLPCVVPGRVELHAFSLLPSCLWWVTLFTFHSFSPTTRLAVFGCFDYILERQGSDRNLHRTKGGTLSEPMFPIWKEKEFYYYKICELFPCFVYLLSKHRRIRLPNSHTFNYRFSFPKKTPAWGESHFETERNTQLQELLAWFSPQ